MDKKEQKKTRSTNVMPHNIEAEQAVLAACIMDNEIAYSILNDISKDDFYSNANKTIFEAMQNLLKKNIVIDLVTLADELELEGVFGDVGGIEYITNLTNVLPSTANYNTYLEIVKRDSSFRTIIKSCNDIIENTYEADDKSKAIEFAEHSIFEIGKTQEQTQLQHISGPAGEVINKFDMLSKNKNGIRGIPTGFKDFDEVTNGLQNSNLIFLAARPGVGKTSFAMNIITNVAIKQKKKCAVFNLEMSALEITQRAICSVASVSMSKALKGNLDSEEWKSLWEANKKLSDADIYIDDSPLNTPMSILGKCRRLKREKGLDLVMIDYLQLMTSGKKKDSENRQNEVSQMTRELKVAARELNIPILVLSQLSRAPDQRKGDHKPQLSDLRESGSIEQDADIVLFIYKPEMYNDVTSEDEPGICTLSIAKHRNGESKDIKLRWIGEYTTFVDKDIIPKTRVVADRIKVIDDNAYGDIPPEEEEANNMDELKDLFTSDPEDDN
ncbi:MAG: replicative DNA helicase [Clostridia bacterium]|nr:replicative DNA helicase [Clostridia bacterium]